MLRLVEMMRLIDYQKRGPARSHERIAVKVEKLRRCHDDVPRAFTQRLEEIGALLALDRSVGSIDAKAERIEATRQAVVLVVGQRAQRIDDQRLATAA